MFNLLKIVLIIYSVNYINSEQIYNIDDYSESCSVDKYNVCGTNDYYKYIVDNKAYLINKDCNNIYIKIFNKELDFVCNLYNLRLIDKVTYIENEYSIIKLAIETTDFTCNYEFNSNINKNQKIESDTTGIINPILVMFLTFIIWMVIPYYLITLINNMKNEDISTDFNENYESDIEDNDDNSDFNDIEDNDDNSDFNDQEDNDVFKPDQNKIFKPIKVEQNIENLYNTRPLSEEDILIVEKEVTKL